jgi:uncharacterized membrane protein
MNQKTRFIAEAAVIAAIYAVLTYVLAPISYGQIQVRISEALTVLPMFTPAAIPGLFIGCLLANILGPNGIIDIIFGSLATLIAAFLSYKLKERKYLVPLPPVLINAVVIGYIISYLYELPLIMSMLWVGVGQTVACYGIGYPLLLLLDKNRGKIFKREK